MLRLLPASTSCTNLVRKNQFHELNWLFHNKLDRLESHTEHHWRCSKTGMAVPMTDPYGPSFAEYLFILENKV